MESPDAGEPHVVREDEMPGLLRFYDRMEPETVHVLDMAGSRRELKAAGIVVSDLDALAVRASGRDVDQ